MSLPALFAYIDPASGAVILQVVAAGIFGGLIYFRRAFGRVADVFTGRAKPAETAGSGPGLGTAPEGRPMPSEIVE